MRSLAHRCSAVALLIITISALNADDWNQWRGSRRDGFSKQANLPVKWGDDQSIAWKTRMPGPGSSQPVAWGDTIFLTCWSGYNPNVRRTKEEMAAGTVLSDKLRLHVVCLNAGTGKILWSKELEPMNRIVQNNGNSLSHHGLATHTPYAEEDRLYVSFGTAGLFCFDHGGNEIWRTSIGKQFSGWDTTPSVVVCGNTIVINAHVECNALLGIDKRTGKELWRQTADMEAERWKHYYDRSWSTPLLYEVDNKSRIALLVCGGFMNVYDPQNGKILWQTKPAGGYACSTPMFDPRKKVLYCFAGCSHSTTTASAWKAGEDVPARERQLWIHKERGSALIPPVLVNGRLYYAGYGGMRPKKIHGVGALDPETGEVIFHRELDVKSKYPEGTRRGRRPLVYANIIANSKRVYVFTQIDGTWVLDATVPEFKVLAYNRLDAGTSSIPMGPREKPDSDMFNAGPIALPGGRLILRSFWGVYCIKAQNER